MARSQPALVAPFGDAKNLPHDRQLTTWLRLVSKQHSTGGKTNLQGISKRGDTYRRTLRINGARAVIRQTEYKLSAQGWLPRLIDRCNKNLAGWR